MSGIGTGTVVRVVDFKAQPWDLDCADYRRAEQNLVGSYLGKVGTVKEVFVDDMPYRVEFSQTAKVVLSGMRFYAEEVDEV